MIKVLYFIINDPNGARTRDIGVAFRCVTILMYT